MRQAAATKPELNITSQIKRHEYAVRIEFVVPKGPALKESNALIESVRRSEGFCGTGLKAQTFVAPHASNFENVIQNRAPSSMAAQGCRRAH
jgi:hypothetical protein